MIRNKQKFWHMWILDETGYSKHCGELSPHPIPGLTGNSSSNELYKMPKLKFFKFLH